MGNTEANTLLPLHPLEFRVLLTLTRGPSYGTRIVDEIEQRELTLGKLYPANLYRRIRDLQRKRLVEETEPPAGADPRRTYVAITPLGRAVARAEAARLRELVEDAVRHDLLPQP